jgi:hypothetical protein
MLASHSQPCKRFLCNSRASCSHSCICKCCMLGTCAGTSLLSPPKRCSLCRFIGKVQAERQGQAGEQPNIDACPLPCTVHASRVGALHHPADKMTVQTLHPGKVQLEEILPHSVSRHTFVLLLSRTAITGAITKIGLMWRRATLGSAVRRTS